MFDSHVALEALGALLGTKVTSVQKQGSDPQAGGAEHQPLSIPHFITKVFHAHEARQMIEFNFLGIPSILQDNQLAADISGRGPGDFLTGMSHIINEKEFFDPGFDYDFTDMKDTETYRRGGEVYERPCGWYRYALKVRDKYQDGNTWLGTFCRSTESEPGEWPVSYHGTSQENAQGIIEGYYKPGTGDVYGRGIYSTPEMNETTQYRRKFTSSKTGKTYEVVLQNRINPNYRKICERKEYWLIPIPDGTPDTKVHEIVAKSIRPYGLLVREVK